MTYYYLKTLHHVLVVIWIFGLIYSAAIFLLSSRLQEGHQTKATEMGWNIWRYGAWPSMILGMISGMAMLHLRLFHLADTWMQVKLVAVILLVALHVRCHISFRRARRAQNQMLTKGPTQWAKLVALGATFGVFFLFLMGLKDSFQWIYGTVIATSVTAIISFFLAKKT